MERSPNKEKKLGQRGDQLRQILRVMAFSGCALPLTPQPALMRLHVAEQTVQRYNILAYQCHRHYTILPFVFSRSVTGLKSAADPP
jgi:hypothetical protein